MTAALIMTVSIVTSLGVSLIIYIYIYDYYDAYAYNYHYYYSYISGCVHSDDFSLFVTRTISAAMTMTKLCL